MKAKYFFKVNQGQRYPWAESNLSANGVDLLELLLASDLSSVGKVEEFKKTVFVNGETWWFNATKVEIKGSELVIYPAFDVSAEAYIETALLKKVLEDWRDFLRSGKEVEIVYSEYGGN